MLNATEMLKSLESEIKKEESEIIQEAVPQEALVNEQKKIEEPEEEDEDFPDDAPQRNRAWKKMRQAEKKAKDDFKVADEARQKTEREVSELKERLARIEGRNESKAPIVETPQEPDRLLDPDAWRDWKIAEQDKKLAEISAKAEQTTQLTQIEGMRRGMSKIEAEYKNTGVKDYDDRIAHIMNAEKQRIKLQYPTATDRQIDNHLESEKFRMANEILGQGRNPAEVFYKLADTYGYQEKKSDKADPKIDIAAINRNMEKNVNLIGSSGADKSGGITPNQLFNSTLNSLIGKDADIKNLIKKAALSEL